jgi:hypothetical protein
MKLRFRPLAALIALIGFLAVSAEGAWAAACTANMEMGSTSVSASVESQAKQCSADAAALRANGAEAPDGNDPGLPHCPSMPLGAAGACGAALALPADLAPQLAPSLREAQLSPRTNSAHELLLAGAFFRPPIA